MWGCVCSSRLMLIVVSRLESVRTTRMCRSASFVRLILSAKGPSSFNVRHVRGALDRKLECNGGAFARVLLDLKGPTDERGPLAHGQEIHGLRTTRRVHQIEADAVVGHV